MKSSVFLAAALTVIGVASVTVISGCAEAPPAQAGRIMTGEDIKNLFNGRSEETTNSEGGIYRAYHPDTETERGRYTAPGGKTTDVTARLSYKADAICAVFEPKDWGTQCYQFVQDGEKIMYRNLKNKKDFGQVKVVDGNPFGF